MRDPAVAPFRVQLERATALPKVPEWERIVTEMQTVAERMVRGQFSVDEAAREIDAPADRPIGRESLRERVGRYVLIWGVAASSRKKINITNNRQHLRINNRKTTN